MSSSFLVRCAALVAGSFPSPSSTPGPAGSAVARSARLPLLDAPSNRSGSPSLRTSSLLRSSSSGGPLLLWWASDSCGALAFGRLAPARRGSSTMQLASSSPGFEGKRRRSVDVTSDAPRASRLGILLRFTSSCASCRPHGVAATSEMPTRLQPPCPRALRAASYPETATTDVEDVTERSGRRVEDYAPDPLASKIPSVRVRSCSPLSGLSRTGPRQSSASRPSGARSERSPSASERSSTIRP